jgi:hypothetical protein
MPTLDAGLEAHWIRDTHPGVRDADLRSAPGQLPEVRAGGFLERLEPELR